MQTVSNKKIIWAWTMYDWANSVYSLVITSSIFPIYYNEATKKAFHGDQVLFFGQQISNTVLASWAISFSFLVNAVMLPLLSGMADYSGKKKRFMQFFAWLGSLSCMGLYFFTGANVEYGIMCAVLASIGYSGSLVFYNAYLPEITTPDQYDHVSARGFAMGYIGSIILMIANLLMTFKPNWFGLADGSLAARAGFVLVGLWWMGFSQITFYYLPNAQRKISGGNLLSKGYHELIGVWKQLRTLPRTQYFLLAFFCYNLGVQTIMYMAAQFGDKELHLDSVVLISAILAIQLVAIAGSYLFADISKRKGNIFSISIMITIWIAVCVGAYFVNSAGAFIALAGVVGMIMGGIQSLSRATYSKLLPETQDHASFFSFYDITDKISVTLGTAVFGLTEALTGSMRNSVWPLMGMFAIGLVVLQFARTPRLNAAKEVAGI